MGEMIGYHKNAVEIIIITTNTKIEISMGIYEEFVSSITKLHYS